MWVNEEDHLRVISMQKGGNMKEVFQRFCTGLTKVNGVVFGIDAHVTLTQIIPPLSRETEIGLMKMDNGRYSKLSSLPKSLKDQSF